MVLDRALARDPTLDISANTTALRIVEMAAERLAAALGITVPARHNSPPLKS